MEFNWFEFKVFLLDQLLYRQMELFILIYIKVKELSLPYYLLIAGERIVGFILFLRILGLCEMQIILFRILAQLAEYTDCISAEE